MEKKYIDDLREIKDIMSRSSRFSALSGLSGIMVGLIGLLASFLAYWFVFKNRNNFEGPLQSNDLMLLLLIAVVALGASIGMVFFHTSLELKKLQQKVWDLNTRRVLANLAIPLLTGGIIGLFFLLQGFTGITIALTLVFYGLALINASKYTLVELRTLGMFEILLGLLALLLVNYSLLFWALGFGLLHIIYGFIIKAKHKA